MSRTEGLGPAAVPVGPEAALQEEGLSLFDRDRRADLSASRAECVEIDIDDLAGHGPGLS